LTGQGDRFNAALDAVTPGMQEVWAPCQRLGEKERALYGNLLLLPSTTHGGTPPAVWRGSGVAAVFFHCLLLPWSTDNNPSAGPNSLRLPLSKIQCLPRSFLFWENRV
jgi:hypothetical protein